MADGKRLQRATVSLMYASWAERITDLVIVRKLILVGASRWLIGFAIAHHNVCAYLQTPMTKRVEYSREAVRTLARIDRPTSKRIRQKIEQLASAPETLANNVKALKGGEGLMRLRVGDWRVIYTEDLVVLHVLRVAPRGSAYD